MRAQQCLLPPIGRGDCGGHDAFYHADGLLSVSGESSAGGIGSAGNPYLPWQYP